MRAMSEAQYKIVKIFLDGFKIPPKKIYKKWNYFWEQTGSKMRIELHEIYRVMLTVNYEVYKNDQIPEEDVILAVEGR